MCSESFDCIWKLFNNSAKKIHFKSPVCLKNFQSIQQLFQSIRKPLALPDNLEFFQDLNHVFFQALNYVRKFSTVHGGIKKYLEFLFRIERKKYNEILSFCLFV